MTSVNWFSNLNIYLDFSAIFLQITQSKLRSQGRHWEQLFVAEGLHFGKALNTMVLLELLGRQMLSS